MIQHEIELEHDIELVEFLQVFPGNEFVVEIVIDNGKAAIKITVENGRKDIEQGENILEFRPLEHVHNVSKVSADTVRVGVEHDAFRHTLFC